MVRAAPGVMISPTVASDAISDSVPINKDYSALKALELSGARNGTEERLEEEIV